MTRKGPIIKIVVWQFERDQTQGTCRDIETIERRCYITRCHVGGSNLCSQLPIRQAEYIWASYRGRRWEVKWCEHRKQYEIHLPGPDFFKKNPDSVSNKPRPKVTIQKSAVVS